MEKKPTVNRLPVLRIGVRSAPDPKIGALAVFEVLRASGAPKEVATVPTRELGLKDLIESVDDVDEGALQIPADVILAVARELEEIADGTDFAYLLELPPPHGYLPLIPWERLLAGSFRRPLLRLPKYDLRPRAAWPLRVVMVAGQAPDYPDFSVAEMVERLVRQWRNVFNPDEVAIEIFVTTADVNDVRRRMHGHPGSATTHAPTPSIGPETKWSDWIGNALRHRAVDIVHMVAHGTFQGERSTLALPRITNGRPRRTIDVNELCAALTRAGAWSLLLSAPEANRCPAALRDLCHDVTENRPAVVALHQFTSSADTDQQAENTLRMLYQGKRPRQEMPDVTCWLHATSAVFVKPKAQHDSEPASRLKQPDGTSALIEAETTKALAENDVPAWVASGTRTLEMLQAQLTGSDGSAPDPDAIIALENVSKAFNRQVGEYNSSRKIRPRRDTPRDRS